MCRELDSGPRHRHSLSGLFPSLVLVELARFVIKGVPEHANHKWLRLLFRLTCKEADRRRRPPTQARVSIERRARGIEGTRGNARPADSPTRADFTRCPARANEPTTCRRRPVPRDRGLLRGAAHRNPRAPNRAMASTASNRRLFRTIEPAKMRCFLPRGGMAFLEK